ncbi:MAG: NAD-dependent epimerase/dehydratase family protein, partial [Kamptonema sp. SIO4C4]|nr:NAD-dependent epimerase/dehydratase family protein [Kamptonema sp. SIO4C4]
GEFIFRFSGDDQSLQKLVKIINHLFGVPTKIEYDTAKGKWVHLWVKLLVDLILQSLDWEVQANQRANDLPNWILQLPHTQLIAVLQGLTETQSSVPSSANTAQFCLTSSSQKIIEKLTLILTKFGLVSAVQENEADSTNGENCQDSYSLTVPGLDRNFLGDNFLWDNSLWDSAQASQTLSAPVTEDIAWATVTAIEAFPLDEAVYDFSVPDYENFIGGSYGICCHNTYGPRMLPNDGRVVSNFIVQALQGIPLTVYGDGSQTRSFCYVSDLIEGFIRLMNSDRTDPVNIGNPGEYTILQLAQTIQSMVNPEAELIFKPLPQDDPKQRQPDITRAKTWLDWQPTVPLDAGLETTIAYFRDRLTREGLLNPKQ